MENRQALRKEMRLRRRALSPQQQALAARNLFRLLKRQPLFIRSRHIALYLANDGEISPHLLLAEARRMGKRCYLPVLAPGSENRLWFVRYDSSTLMITNRYGIPEPRPNPRRALGAAQLDLVLMPLVAFDSNGGRLGMGGGFYDRTFAFKQPSHEASGHHKAQKPYLLGLAHSCQQAQQLPLEHWDIPLHAIATEQKIFLGQSIGKHRDFACSDIDRDTITV